MDISRSAAAGQSGASAASTASSASTASTASTASAMPAAPGASGLYCAVIADVVHSRSLADRSGFQRQFLDLVERAGTMLPPGELVSRFVVTAGDELQGLLRTPAPAYDFLVALEDELGRGRFRMGVGWGCLATDLKPVCLGMDGPAFHLARAALEESKKRGRALTYRLGNAALDDLLTSYAALLDRTRLSWTPRQWEQVKLLAANGDQSSVAAALGISRAAVNKALKSAGWRVYDKARADLLEYLSTPGVVGASGAAAKGSPGTSEVSP